MHGMEVLAKAVQGKRVTLVLGVQGKDIAEMREYATRADALNPDAVIAMPPTTGTSMDDYRAYFRALAAITKRPVFVQTSGGARDLPPTTDLIVELAKEFPHFGYVKEESQPVIARMKAELHERPTMKGFSARASPTAGSTNCVSVSTGSSPAAACTATCWRASGTRTSTDGTTRCAMRYSKFLLMRNLEEQIPGTDLYIMKKRGVFKTTVRRTSAPQAGAPPKLTEFKPSPVELEEIEFRFAALKPYLAGVVRTFRFACGGPEGPHYISR